MSRPRPNMASYYTARDGFPDLEKGNIDAEIRRSKIPYRMCGVPLPDAYFEDEEMETVELPFVIPFNNNYLFSTQAANAQKYEAAYHYQSRYAEDVVEFYRANHPRYWDFRYMKNACNGLRLAALRADRVNNNQGTYIKRAAVRMEIFYKFCTEDRGTKIGLLKIKGVLIPLNHILRIYTALELYDVSRTVIGIAVPTIADKNFCMNMLVSFRFHVGRMAALDRHYEDALQHWHFAFLNCNEYYKKVRTILIYLLPLEIILGCYTIAKLVINQYQLSFFFDLSAAVHSGNLPLFRDITEKHIEYFSKDSLFVMLGDLKDMVYTNVFKNVYEDNNYSSFVPISAYLLRLQALVPTEKFDYWEILYLVGSLIVKNKIKGYVSNDSVVVLCPYDPFPRFNHSCVYPKIYTVYN